MKLMKIIQFSFDSQSILNKPSIEKISTMNSKVFIILLVVPALTVFAKPTENESEKGLELIADGDSSVRNQNFINIGEFAGIEDSRAFKREYYVSIHKNNWIGAAAACHRSGLKFLEMKTKEEQQAVNNLAQQYEDLVGAEMLVGGFATQLGNQFGWHWMESGSRVITDLNWASGSPDNDLYEEYCLAFQNDSGKFKFIDVTCFDRTRKFLCYREQNVL